MPDLSFADIVRLEQAITKSSLPPDLRERLLLHLARLEGAVKSGVGISELDIFTRYTNWLLVFPWIEETKDILDLTHAKEVLDRNHYGLTHIKERILEYLSVLILKSNSEGEKARAPILALIGLVGTGKTSLAFSIAEALGRKAVRIPFGGLGDALQLRGQPRHYPGAEPGLLLKSLCRVKSHNPVVLLDEIDRVASEHKADIMGVLVEMLDPQQNAAFIDHYFDYPVNLQSVLFVATANNTTNISTAVLDRLEILQLPSYSDEEKIVIGKSFLLPRAIKESGLAISDVSINDKVWPLLVRPLGFDAGMRTLERTLQGIVRKLAFLKVSGRMSVFSITEANVRDFLPV